MDVVIVKYVGLMKTNFTKQLIPSLDFNIAFLLSYEKLVPSQTWESSAEFSGTKLHCCSSTGFRAVTPYLLSLSENRVEAKVLHVFLIKCLWYGVTKTVF